MRSTSSTLRSYGISYEARILGGVLGQAAGDAFGLPWEGTPAAGIELDPGDPMPRRNPVWSRGATSDDTALMLLALRHLAERDRPDPRAFARDLVEQAPGIPGLGPSTRAAIAHFRAHGSISGGSADTNGAAMRALPVGWVVPTDDVGRRRAWTITLSQVTHGGANALAAACLVAACASWTVDGLAPAGLLEPARTEAGELDRGATAGHKLVEVIDRVATGRWSPAGDGVSLDAAETVGAVLAVCAAAEDDLERALADAVRLGGDTDTVAGLVGGLHGAFLGDEAVRALPWFELVQRPDEAEARRLAATVAERRLSRSGRP